MRSRRRPEGVDWWIWENYTKHERHCPRCLRTWTDEKWYGTKCFKGTCKPFTFFPDSIPEQSWKTPLPYPMPGPAHHEGLKASGKLRIYTKKGNQDYLLPTDLEEFNKFWFGKKPTKKTRGYTPVMCACGYAPRTKSAHQKHVKACLEEIERLSA